MVQPFVTGKHQPRREANWPLNSTSKSNEKLTQQKCKNKVVAENEPTKLFDQQHYGMVPFFKHK